MGTNPKTIFHDWRTSSTKNWGTSLEAGQTLTREQIQTGALLRIADATEAMAKNHFELIEELERSKRIYKTTLEENARLIKQVNAYKGHLRKAKEQLNPSVFYIHESSGKIGQFVKEVGNPKKIYIKMKSGVIYSDISNNFKKL